MVADQNVKKDEVKTIMTSIFHNKENIPELREAVDIIISDYQTIIIELILRRD